MNIQLTHKPPHAIIYKKEDEICKNYSIGMKKYCLMMQCQ